MKQVKEESSMEEKRPYWWWFDSHNRPRHSHWLHSTLAELDDMTKAMLRLIEEDADSFAERAEMYYKKRPELISMVEDFYRSYRSLAERYDQLKNDSNPRVTFPKATSLVKSYDDCYIDEAYDSESEVDDPEGEECFHANGYVEEKARFGKVSYDEVMKLREEVDQLRVEKMALEEEGGRTNEEKEKVARQLNEAIDELVKLKEETGTLRAETMALREQLERKDEVNKDIARQIDEMSSQMTKLREESHRENQSYKEELLQKNKEQSKITSQLHEAKTKLAKLREETDALRLNAVALGEELKRKDLEKIKIAKQIDEVFEKKDEEKREVIRQLTVAIQMMKDENLQLKRSFMKETSKNGGPFEFKMFKKPVSLG